MPESHERSNEKTELSFRRENARAEYELPLFDSDTSGTGSSFLGAVSDILSNIKVDITDSRLQNNTLNAQEIATDVTQNSNLNLTESCFNQEAYGSQHDEEVLNHERLLSKDRKILEEDNKIVESKHSVFFIDDEVSVLAREKSFREKDDTTCTGTFESNSPKQSASLEIERWNLRAQTEQEVSEIVYDTLRLISEVLHLEGEQTEANTSCSRNQETQLMQESTKLDKSDTEKKLLNISQDRACAKRDSFPRSQTTNTEQSTADDPGEISPVLHDAPLVFPETSNIAISIANESAVKREKSRFIRSTPSTSDVESSITSDVTEMQQTDLIDSGQANPPENSFAETNTQQQFHIEVKTHPDGGWGWVVCLGAFLVQFIALGMQNTAGIVYTELVKELKSQRGATGWKVVCFLKTDF